MTTDLFNKRLTEFNARAASFIRQYGAAANSDTGLLAVNDCGSCTACCIHPSISAEQYATGRLPVTKAKAFGAMCQYCDGKSCQVYDARPVVCKGYQCLYRFGLTDKAPNVTGVAWSLEPAVDTIRSWSAVGHCYNVDVILAEPSLVGEIIQLIGSMVLGLPIGFVVLRSTKHVVRVTVRDSNLQVETCDILQEGMFDRADIRTLRVRILQVLAKEVSDG